MVWTYHYDRAHWQSGNLPAPSPWKHSGHSQMVPLSKWFLTIQRIGNTKIPSDWRLHSFVTLWVCEDLKYTDNGMKWLTSICLLKKPLSTSLSLWDFYFKASPVNPERLLGHWWEKDPPGWLHGTRLANHELESYTYPSPWKKWFSPS